VSKSLNYIFSDQGIEELRNRLGLEDPDNEIDGYDGDNPVEDIDDINEPIDDNAEFVQEDTIDTDYAPAVEPGGLTFPWPITVSNITSRIAPDGSTVFDLIVSFDDVSGATDYEVRYVAGT
jgi:hypothetical protein